MYVDWVRERGLIVKRVPSTALCMLGCNVVHLSSLSTLDICVYLRMELSRYVIGGRAIMPPPMVIGISVESTSVSWPCLFKVC